MKGGFNNPPNFDVEGGKGDKGDASMKGGFNNPPNAASESKPPRRTGASMKGGFNNPPNIEPGVVGTSEIKLQ